jgi:succinate-semialdehyde dehydrogenase / glutarate-semialdehyde dehydrogenase
VITAPVQAPESLAPRYPQVLLFIDGVWRQGAGRETLSVENPADRTELGRVAVATPGDLDDAVVASVRGFESWSRLPPAVRGERLRAAAMLLRERADCIATWLTLENGKPLAEALSEVRMAADLIDWFAEQGRRVDGRLVAPRLGGQMLQVRKEPVGPVAAFTPWNFPINQAVRKIAPALSAGCSIIVKAAEETPAAPAELVRAFADAELPAGAINLVYGRPEEISRHLVTHPAIRKLSFTGSTAVGKQLAALAGRHMKRVTMELGGHAAVIVAEDADLTLSAQQLAVAKFRNAGQVCISPTRFLVANAVKREFIERFVTVVRQIQVGQGLAPASTMGPLANARRLSAAQQLTDDAVERGAQVATGGHRLGDTGYFFAPTVLVGVPCAARVFNEEPFGPLAAIQGYDELAQAIAEANRLPFGLAAYAYTRSLATMNRLAERVEAGMLWINQPTPAWPELPFGGIKDSGLGSEGGPEALEAYLNTKSVIVQCEAP